MYVDWQVFEEEWYGKAMLGTLPYLTLPYPTLPYPNPKPAQPHPAPHHLTQPYPLHLPYPTLTPNPTPNPPHRTRPTPLNPTPNLTPTPYIYPTLPYPHPHPTQLLPYSCPAIHRLALPCPTIPYPTLPLYMYVRSDVSVVLLSISVYESGLVLSFRSVLFQSNRYRPDELGQVRR